MCCEKVHYDVVYTVRYPPLSAARWSTLTQVLSLVLPLQHLLPESDTYSVERTSALDKCYACSTLFFFSVALSWLVNVGWSVITTYYKCSAQQLVL